MANRVMPRQGPVMRSGSLLSSAGRTHLAARARAAVRSRRAGRSRRAARARAAGRGGPGGWDRPGEVQFGRAGTGLQRLQVDGTLMCGRSPAVSGSRRGRGRGGPVRPAHRRGVARWSRASAPPAPANALIAVSTVLPASASSSPSSMTSPSIEEEMCSRRRSCWPVKSLSAWHHLLGQVVGGAADRPQRAPHRTHPAYRTRARAAAAMWSAEMPAASSSSRLLPDPGSSRTARCRTSSSVWPAAGEGVEDGAAQPTLGMVVLDQDETSFRGGGGRDEGVDIDGLDRIQVDDAGPDAVAGQLLGRGQAFVQGDPGTDQGHVVLGGGSHRLGAPDRQLSSAG